MAGFLAAHGYDPGPTQRPLLAGSISGALATIPAIPILYWFGSLEVEAAILGIDPLLTLAAGVAVMAAAGAVYGRLFGRAANDLNGGWLFAMAFGFALWAAGAIVVLPILSGGLTPAGAAATGVLLSLLAWGCSLGIIFPLLHPLLHERLEVGSSHEEVGPGAASKRGPARGEPKRHPR
jgi:hypothetical protein